MAYSDYHAILSDPAVDAVFICPSTDMHSPISFEAVRAGKHIFCEKPIDHDLDRIKAMIDAVQASGVKYHVGFIRRFGRNYKRFHEVVKAGGVGDLHIVKVMNRAPEARPSPLSRPRAAYSRTWPSMICFHSAIRSR